jgi:serine protease Do
MRSLTNGSIMSYFSSSNARFTRSRVLASAAVLALVASGAGEMAWSQSSPDHAPAAVSVSDSQTQSMPSFAPLIARVKPAVVSVQVKIANVSADTNDLSGQMGNLPPEIQQFFKRFGESNGASPQIPSTPMTGEGSGFFISADGYIVTNNHVVQNAQTVTVTMDDGRTLDAKVVGTDPKTDLALLKVSQPGNYPFVSFAKDAPRVGDWVVAIGNPYGLGGTATAGIVSAEGRDIGDGPYDRFLQIDAPINKGNSGGPAFNMKGEVVGVNTAIFSPSGGSVGIGFAIPASTADSVVNALELRGVVARGYLGVMIQPVSQDIADGLGLKTAAGAIVDQVTPGTPAAEAGLKSGDVITKLDGQPIADAGDLTRRVGSFKPGNKVELTYLRDGAERTVSITLASQTNEKVAKAGAEQNNPAPLLGVQLAPSNKVAGSGDKGVVIVNVDPNGAAASKGLVAGDVILEVAGRPVSNPDQVKSEIASAKQDGKKALLMRVQTANGDRFVAIAFPKA